LLAADSVLDRDPAGWPHRHPQGDPGSRGHRRRRFLADAFPDQPAHDGPHPQRGRALRDHLHFHRHDRGLHPDRGRPLRFHADAAFLRLCYRHSRQRSGGRSRRFTLSGAGAGLDRLPDAAPGPPRGGGVMKRKLAARIVHALVLGAFVVMLAFPFFWMAVATFKQDADLYATENNPFLFNLPPTMNHLKYLFGHTDYLRWIGNTALVGALVVAINQLLSVPAAYALARLTGRWGERLGIGIFLTYLVPPTLLFIPLSRVVAVLGLQDTMWSLVLVYPSITVPFSVWLLMGFFKSIPR